MGNECNSLVEVMSQKPASNLQTVISYVSSASNLQTLARQGTSVIFWLKSCLKYLRLIFRTPISPTYNFLSSGFGQNTVETCSHQDLQMQDIYSGRCYPTGSFNSAVACPPKAMATFVKKWDGEEFWHQAIGLNPHKRHQSQYCYPNKYIASSDITSLKRERLIRFRKKYKVSNSLEVLKNVWSLCACLVGGFDNTRQC